MSAKVDLMLRQISLSPMSCYIYSWLQGTMQWKDKIKLKWVYVSVFLKSVSGPSYVNLPLSRWCNTRQTEDRFWVSIATWRRRQYVSQRSVCTLCPASPSTTRTVLARLAVRQKPQVGTAISQPPNACQLDCPVPVQSGQILSVISDFSLQP